MTFREKPVVKRAHRTALESSGRRTLYLNLFFGGVVLLGVLILGGAAGATYWNDHYASLASVNGVGINKDQFRERLLVENFRLDYLERQIRTDQAAGRISEATAEQQLGILAQRRQGLGDAAIENLIDATLIQQLAEKEGITVSEEEITARLRRDATVVERRRASIISAVPETSEGATDPTDEQKAAARADAERMLAEIKAGKPFEEVAKAGSDDVSKANGGDLGYLNREAQFYDERLVEALFGLQVNGVSEVIEGDDGTFYIARVTDIVPESENTAYEQELRNADVSPDAYRRVLRGEVVQEKLETKILESVTAVATPQRRVSEIFIASDPSEAASPGDEVNVRHILYSPNDDPSAAQTLPEDDPAWKAAEDAARAAHAELVQDPTKFAEVARASSDDAGTRDQGGELGFLKQGDLDPAFGDAIFAEGLTKDQILEPVRTSFGWHIIQFVERRDSPQDRIRAVELEAAAGRDFAELAAQYSESPTKNDGGDVGWIARYQLDSVRESAIFAAPLNGLTPVITIAEGLYIYKITAEETRLPDAEQLPVLEGSAFSNWYIARKNESTITREYQAGSQPAPIQ
jgi:parvulin-like peptidyl-prolyl isomerase